LSIIITEDKSLPSKLRSYITNEDGVLGTRRRKIDLDVGSLVLSATIPKQAMSHNIVFIQDVNKWVRILGQTSSKNNKLKDLGHSQQKLIYSRAL
jgi:hypothetical protein